jgi:hypothetical protein
VNATELSATDTITGNLPASTVAFLYAHRFAPAAKPGKSGTRSLANESVVETAPLAHMLVKVALFSLHEAGAVQLQPFDEKRLKFLPSSGVRVRLLDSSVNFGSIEGEVLSELAGDKKSRERGMDISLLANLLYRDGKPPESRVLKTVIDDAVTLGYAKRVPTDVGVVKQRLTGRPSSRLEPDRDRIKMLAGEADGLVSRWNAFMDAQGNTGSRLSSAVNEAFSLLRRRDDD